jgi:hypothetical protein
MSSFQVTTPNVRLGSVKPGSSTEVTHMVANVTGGVRRGSYSVVTKDEGTANWYKIKGETSSEFAPNASKPVTVIVSPPAAAQPKDGYRFHLVVGIEPQADVEFDNGPDVTFDLSAAKRSFPWLYVILGIVLVVVIAALVAFFFRPRPAPPPPGVTVPADLTGKTAFQAASEMSGLGMPIAQIRTCGGGPTVTSTDPAAGQTVAQGGILTLRLGLCLRPFPHATINPDWFIHHPIQVVTPSH